MINGGLFGGVHVVPVDGLVEAGRLVAELYHQFDLRPASPRVRTLHVRGSRCRTSTGLFDELAAVLQFPAYFGGNWSALHDSLYDFRVPADAVILVFSDFSLVLSEAEQEELGWLLEELTELCGAPRTPASGERSVTALLTDHTGALTALAKLLPGSNRTAEMATLTSREAFLVMSDFLWRFAQRAGDDLITLLGDTALEADGEPTDPAAWEDWVECVSRIKSGLLPRANLQ